MSATVPTPATRKANFPPILTWQNPVKTGTLVAELLGALLLLRYGNLLRFGLRVTYWAVGFSGIAEYASRLVTGKKQGVVSSYKPSRFINISQVTVEKYANKAAKASVDTIHDVKKLFDAEDLSLSLTVFIGAFFAYLLTGVLSISTLLIVGVVLAFAVPPIYLKFQKEIDHFAAIAHQEATKHANTASTHVNKAIGPHLDVAKKHVANVSSIVGLNRGGFPSDATKSAKTTSADVPPVGTVKAAEPVVKTPKIAESSVPPVSSVTTHTSTSSSTTLPKKPVAPEAASANTAAYPDILKYDTVPTLTGSINLNPDLPAKADIPVAASKAAETPSTLKTDGVDLASELKQSIAEDKKLPSF